MKKNDHQQWAKIVAKAWSDPHFKEQLMQNPEDVLREEGIEVPKHIQLSIHENTDTHLYLVLPQKPQGALTEQQIETISAGYSEYMCWPPGASSSR